MNREQIKGHSLVSCVCAVSSSVPAEVQESAVSNPVKSLLRMIYTYNQDGTISGAIQQYMSEKISPDVREYIRQNLLRPTQSVDSYTDVPDDMIMELTVQRGESRYDYAARVRDFLDKATRDVEDLRAKVSDKKE